MKFFSCLLFVFLFLFFGSTIYAQDSIRTALFSFTKKTPKDVKEFRLYGDFRVRVEEDVKSDVNRFRERFRIRGGVHTQISSVASFHLRLISTANADNPNSSHVNLNDGFNPIKIVIDRAYFQLKPHQFPAFQWRVGKFPNPMVSSKVYDELVWDADIQPEGTSFLWRKISLGKKGKLTFSNGTYFLSQFKTDSRKNWLNTTQISTDWELSKTWKINLTSGFYYFGNTKGQEVTNTIFDKNEGNSTFDEMNINGVDTSFTTYYATDFYLSDNFMLLEYQGLSMPLLFKLQLIYNLGAAKSNQGYVVGLSYGDLKVQKRWKIYYQYHQLQQDAIFTPFTQDDALARTNDKGHIFGIAYAFHKKISLHAWALIDSDIAKKANTQSRFRLDLNVKF